MIWTSPDRVPLVDETLKLMGPSVRPIGVGGPRLAEIDQLAQRLDCPREDDLRKLLVDRPAQFVLLASMDDASRDDVLAAVGQGSTVLALEPIASNFDQLPPVAVAVKPVAPPLGAHAPGSAQATGVQGTDTGNRTGKGRIIWVPAFEKSSGWISAAYAEQELGGVEFISVSSFGQANDCSLFARLYDAWRIILMLDDLSEQTTASLSGPLREVPEDPRGITGHLGVHTRLTNGRTAVLQVSDRAGRSGRVVQIIGDRGHLCVSEAGYRLYDAVGRCLDKSTEASQQPPSYAQLIASHWADLIDRLPTAQPPKPLRVTDDAVLACCLASLLSTRTGDPESPQKFLDLHNRV